MIDAVRFTPTFPETYRYRADFSRFPNRFLHRDLGVGRRNRKWLIDSKFNFGFDYLEISGPEEISTTLSLQIAYGFLHFKHFHTEPNLTRYWSKMGSTAF